MSPKQGPQDEQSADVLVTVEADYRDKLAEVSSRLRSAGLTEEARYEFSGVISGKAAQEDIAKLREVEGVAAVEREPTFHAN